MSSNEIKVGSFTELIDELYVNSWDPGLKRYRSNDAFMGLTNANYALETSLMRLGGPFRDLEFHLIRNFRKYAQIEGSQYYSIWNWLVIAQHHGLPTRLMDWTFSPFVAMHFATSDIKEKDVDGAIWCVDFVRIHEDLPEVLRDKLKREGANSFTVEMLSEVAGSLKEFDDISSKDFVLFFDPPSMDARIVNQYAMNSVISNPETSMESVLKHYPDMWRKIVIPSELKWEVLDKLDQANINERILFPGLDGLSRWLTRHYSFRK